MTVLYGSCVLRRGKDRGKQMWSLARAVRVVTSSAPARRSCGRYRQSQVMARLWAIPASYCSIANRGDDSPNSTNILIPTTPRASTKFLTQ
jgi:hypothetical protein